MAAIQYASKGLPKLTATGHFPEASEPQFWPLVLTFHISPNRVVI